MNFDDEADGSRIELRISRGDGVRTVRGELHVSAKKGTQRSAAIPVEKIAALAAWLDDLWDEKAACCIDELGLQLHYSHREHIGEVFYKVLVDGKPVKLVYEQAGTSNCARAADLKRELALALDE